MYDRYSVSTGETAFKPMDGRGVATDASVEGTVLMTDIG